MSVGFEFRADLVPEVGGRDIEGVKSDDFGGLVCFEIKYRVKTNTHRMKWGKWVGNRDNVDVASEHVGETPSRSKRTERYQSRYN